MIMEYLKFHTEELPQMAGAGARYVVVACCGSWRDGEVTNSTSHIPKLRRELRKRFMNRFAARLETADCTATEHNSGKGVLSSS